MKTKLCLFLIFTGICNTTSAVFPLHDAAKVGSVPLIQALVASGIPVNSEDSQKMTPLHHAANVGNPAAVSALLALGANANARSLQSYTPLHLIAATLNLSANHIECARIILNCAGINITTPNLLNNTPLADAQTFLELRGGLDAKDIGYHNQLVELIQRHIAAPQETLAFALAFHNRAGAHSPANLLAQDGQNVALRATFEYLINS